MVDPEIQPPGSCCKCGKIREHAVCWNCGHVGASCKICTNKGEPMPVSPAGVSTGSGLATTTATFYGAKKPKPKKKKVAKKGK